MEKFENEYEYTNRVITEAMTMYWKAKNKSNYLSIGVILIFMVLLMVLGKFIAGVICITGAIIIFVSLEQKKKQLIEEEINRRKTLYQNDIVKVKVIISDKIQIFSNMTERIICFKDVESLAESNNLIVLICKGNLTVSIKKDRFIEGTAEQCVSYLKNLIL